MTRFEHKQEAERLLDVAKDVIRRADAARRERSREEWIDAHVSATELVQIAGVHAALAGVPQPSPEAPWWRED